jgi:membrane protease YdiL (CAAX protease family)
MRGMLLLVIGLINKIVEMGVGSKSFPQESAPPAVLESPRPLVSSTSRKGSFVWLEILIVFGLLEAVMWTPRSAFHSCLIVLEVAVVLWLGLQGYSKAELGLVWPSWAGTLRILLIGGAAAIAIPLLALATGHAVPANADWPQLKNLWPYVIWAFAQQFLLQSFFFVRVESLVGSRWAVIASTLLFTLAHLPNAALTIMTFVGALFFTELFRRYRSIYPLGIVHAILGIAIAYSFPDSIMHHMRVGLSYWQFH